ncbi:hypothetical protein OCK74_11005 [Chitinophagaceae bacterium LB-8]|uniref:Lipocalin-like domain-containing protein n=1 Tax=Paraflavisolibacter caeni TaxID=2982496 RepID=A0A9X2XVZ4_9BACT|nr:hypothetical protein [Paraflavisolibacter caeni]MCU7549646.1 hypothetical protein [Paraflavisolibacter caeni]
MKSSFLLMGLIGFVFFSCTKFSADCDHKSEPKSLDGTWKMVLVKDNSTSAVTTKPSTVQGDVILTFISNSPTTGSFTGKTPSNDIGTNAYTTGPNQRLSIPNLNMTKVGETSWGGLFVDNIRNAQQYSFEAGEKLNIKTSNKILAFNKQ